MFTKHNTSNIKKGLTVKSSLFKLNTGGALNTFHCKTNRAKVCNISTFPRFYLPSSAISRLFDTVRSIHRLSVFYCGFRVILEHRDQTEDVYAFMVKTRYPVNSKTLNPQQSTFDKSRGLAVPDVTKADKSCQVNRSTPRTDRWPNVKMCSVFRCGSALLGVGSPQRMSDGELSDCKAFMVLTRIWRICTRFSGATSKSITFVSTKGQPSTRR